MRLENDPALVNREPFEGGWLFKVRLNNASERDNLLSPESYEELIAQAE